MPPHFLAHCYATATATIIIIIMMIMMMMIMMSCRHMSYSFRLTARVLLYAQSHRLDCTYHGLCYTSRGALAGTRNSPVGPPHEGSIRQPILPRNYISLGIKIVILRTGLYFTGLASREPARPHCVSLNLLTLGQVRSGQCLTCTFRKEGRKCFI